MNDNISNFAERFGPLPLKQCFTIEKCHWHRNIRNKKHTNGSTYETAQCVECGQVNIERDYLLMEFPPFH